MTNLHKTLHMNPMLKIPLAPTLNVSLPIFFSLQCHFDTNRSLGGNKRSHITTYLTLDQNNSFSVVAGADAFQRHRIGS
jgi:hypothetical protein